MKRLIELKEYQYITCNADYENVYSNYKYLEPDIFAELENFICEFKQSDQVNAIDFLNVGFKKSIGRTIQARNFVGLIQLKNGYQIQILPKIEYCDSAMDTKGIFLKMLRCMQDFPSKVFNSSNLKMDRMNLYEIFINMYAQEVRNLVKRGIRSAYLQEENNQNYFKGKLKVQEHIKHNLVHNERFFVVYDEFGVNRPENKLIKSTLLKLLNISGSAENIKEIQRLLMFFELVEPSSNYDKDFSLVVIDRNIKHYETAVIWSKVFLTNKSFTTFSGDTSCRALLFPMERVFEAYVARNLKSILGDIGWLVSAQDKGYYLFDDPKQFALRPDIVITKPDDSIIIMDTKWKSLSSNPRINYGISQSDMYQMYAYAKKYSDESQTPEVWLLYPVNEETIDMKDISFSSNDSVIVRVFFVDVANIADSLVRLRNKLIQGG